MLRLRPYKPNDAQYIVTWSKDEKSFYQWSADRFGKYPLSADALNAHYDAAGDDFFAMTAFDETGVVGQLIMRFLDEEKRDVRLGFIIVDPVRRGKGYGKEMLALANDYAFRILKAKRVSLGVFENNDAAHYCYRAAGLHDTDGSWVCHLMGEDWKCIEMEINAQEYFVQQEA